MRENVKSLYLDYVLIVSQSRWKEKWCYIGNHEPKLPKLTGHRLTWNNRWLDEPSHGNSLQLPKLLDRIAKLKQQGLTRVGVAFNFMKRRVQPLQLRCTWGYDYSRVNELSRMSPEELSVDEVMAWLRRLLKNASEILMIVREFCTSNPPSNSEAEEEEEDKIESFSSSDSEVVEEFMLKARPSDKVGSSSGSSKHVAEDDMEAELVPPPKKNLTITVKRAVNKPLIAEDVPPPVVREVTEVDRATTEVMLQQLPVIEEVIEIEDDAEHLVARANPASAQTT
uniref:Uncharacterized protein n=1 Tax=Setaria viridis TaxID=4556 RepID=A0A4U6UXF9_SETVI|nr:hypothetical protein SEVIR_4G163400v2 [Setaria viridis]